MEDPDLSVSLCVPGGATASASIGKVLGREAPVLHTSMHLPQPSHLA